MIGDHKDGKTNDDVQFLFSSKKAFFFFPQNLHEKFPKLEFITFFSANISTLRKSDLESFGSQLKILNFYDNNLEVIEADLFEENPNLVSIDLGLNKIKHVAEGALNNLKNLKYLGFQSNPCHSGNGQNRQSVIEFIQEIENKCGDHKVEENNPKNYFEVRIEEITEKNLENDFEVKVKELEDIIANLKVKNEKLQRQNSELIKKISKITREL